jgi:hypothetical protein
MVPQVTKDTKRVALFDHEDERVTLAAPLPLSLVGGPGGGYVLRLTEVRGRLGLGVCADTAKIEVWVRSRPTIQRADADGVWQRPAGSHFALGGYALTAIADDNNRKHVITHNTA